MANISCFFLGANSSTGFFSLYDQLIDLETARDVFIIKGGPGCGKSSFMRRISGKLLEAGVDVEHICCSSDPESLDGIVAEELGVAIVDGTAPHVMEPRYPGVVEKYIDLGRYYNTQGLCSKRDEIIKKTKQYVDCYQRIYRFIAGAKLLGDDAHNMVVKSAPVERIKKRAQGIVSRELPRGDGFKSKKRFLSAITPSGVICRFDSVRNLCSKVYEISDNYGLAHFMLRSILESAQIKGLEVIQCMCPLSPESKLEHLIFPSLGLGFVSSGDFFPYDAEPYRRIRLDPLVDPELLKSSRQRLRFYKKTSQALLLEAELTMRSAKKLHDELEALYNPYVDFGGVYESAEELAGRLLK